MNSIFQRDETAKLGSQKITVKCSRVSQPPFLAVSANGALGLDYFKSQNWSFTLAGILQLSVFDLLVHYLQNLVHRSGRSNHG